MIAVAHLYHKTNPLPTDTSVVWIVDVESSRASESCEELVKTQITVPSLELLFQKLWKRARCLLSEPILRWCWCCWSRDHTWVVNNVPGNYGFAKTSRCLIYVSDARLSHPWRRIHYYIWATTMC